MTDNIQASAAQATDVAPAGLAFRRQPRAGVIAVRSFAALSVASAVFAVVGRLTGQEALTLIGGYGLVFFGVGGAPFQLKTDLDLSARLTGAVLVGFSVLLGVGSLMADLHGLWHPVLAAVAVGTVAAVLHLRGFLRAQQVPAPAERGGLPQTRAQKTSAKARQTSLLVTAAGTAMWLAPALWTRDPNPTFWGMLPKLGPLWFAGLGVVLIGFILGRRSEISAAASALSFGLASTLTSPLVYGVPSSQTAQKQMQLTLYVLDRHHINVTAGIYQAFSGMFSGMAWFCELLHVHGLLGHHSLFAIATYWPVLLVFMRVAELRLLAGRLLPTTGRRWGVVILVLLVDTIGADYFSPQSIGYVMAIGAAAIAVNGIGPRPFNNRVTFCLLALVGVSLAPTHELSPYMLAGALLILAVFGQAPRWAWLPITVPALAWAAVVHTAIKQNFNFGALFDISNFRPPVTLTTPGLQRLAIVGLQSHALLGGLLILIALGAVGFFFNIRQKRVWAYSLCPIVGIALIAINPYGNEGIFRAALFAIPWMAVVAMMVPQPRGIFARPALLSGAMAACLACLITTFVVASFAMDATDVLYRANLVVEDYLAGLPARNAFVLSVGAGDNPADAVPFTVNYSSFEWTQVATVSSLVSGRPNQSDLLGLADKYGFVAAGAGADKRSPLYIVWARWLVLYAQAYGLETPAQLTAWLHWLEVSPDWRLVLRDGDTYLFELQRR